MEEISTPEEQPNMLCNILAGSLAGAAGLQGQQLCIPFENHAYCGIVHERKVSQHFESNALRQHCMLHS